VGKSAFMSKRPMSEEPGYKTGSSYIDSPIHLLYTANEPWSGIPRIYRKLGGLLIWNSMPETCQLEQALRSR
jgi:hypothetical protein